MVVSPINGTPGVILGRKAKVLEETTSSNERVVVRSLFHRCPKECLAAEVR